MSNSPVLHEVRRRHGWLIGIALLAAGIAIAYHNTFFVPELLDDPSAISGNASIRKLWPLGPVLDPPADSGAGGRPLVNLTFALNYAWSGAALWSYHVFNLAVHLGAACLLFGIVRRSLRFRCPENSTRDFAGSPAAVDSLALATAFLWAVHPVATSSVTYLSQRAESLMGLFYLATLYGFIRGVDERSRRWHWLSAAACFAGMVTKEVMVTAPVAVLLYDRTFFAGSFRNAFRTRRVYYASLFAAWIFLAFFLHDLGQRQVGFATDVAWWRYLMTECRAWLLYGKLSAWPNPLVFDYGRLYLDWPTALPFIAAAGFLIAITLRALQVFPVFGFFLASFLLVLAPTSTVVPIAQQPVAENRIYLPSAIVVTALTVGLNRVLGRRAFPMLALATLGLIVITERRNEIYRSPLRLWFDTIAKAPQNARAFDHVGQTLHAAGRHEEAIAQYRAALRLNEQSDASHGLIADTYAALNNYEEAARHYQRAIELSPRSAKYYFNLGSIYTRAGQLGSAFENYAKAVQLAPSFADAHANLGTLSISLGRYGEAVDHLEKALQLGYNDGRTRALLGALTLQLGRNTEALGYFENAIVDNPADPDVRNNYGVALLRFDRLEEAARQFEAALKLKPDHAAARETLEKIRAQTKAR
jgi:tetratricopeptide (TPR) repeat protein